MVREVVGAGLLGLFLQCGACHAPHARSLLDGCYYLGGEPILTLRGAAGRLLIPGDVEGFRLNPQGSSDFIWMTTRPSFVIVGDGQARAVITQTPSPIIIIDYDNPSEARVVVRHNGQRARLVRRDTCIALDDRTALATDDQGKLFQKLSEV